jgi:hypothetical protein
MKLKMIAASAAALVLSATVASATCYGYGCYGSGQAAEAGANAGGFAGTAMNGHWSKTWSKQNADVFTRADTKPEYGTGVASLEQRTGGWAMDRDSIGGDLLMEGETSASAKVGRRGVDASTSTLGTGVMGGSADGRYSSVSGNLSGESEQGSFALDTSFGGVDKSHAQQMTSGSVHASAKDRDMATTEVGVSVFSAATAD